MNTGFFSIALFIPFLLAACTSTTPIPRELRSLAALQAAEAAGEVTVTRPGIVVNMPVLVWPGGHR